MNFTTVVSVTVFMGARGLWQPHLQAFELHLDVSLLLLFLNFLISLFQLGTHFLLCLVLLWRNSQMSLQFVASGHVLCYLDTLLCSAKMLCLLKL